VGNDSASGAITGAKAGKNAIENNWLSATQALTFDKELSDCHKSGGNCQAVIDKWQQVSDKKSAATDQKLKDDPEGTQEIDKEQLEIKPPRAVEELPTIIHARCLGSH
jgi:hypothetical protein